METFQALGLLLESKFRSGRPQVVLEINIGPVSSRQIERRVASAEMIRDNPQIVFWDMKLCWLWNQNFVWGDRKSFWKLTCLTLMKHLVWNHEVKIKILACKQLFT